MKLLFSLHAVERMRERNISPAEVEEVIKFGTTIESYPQDRPYPSRLLFKMVEGRPLHVVVAEASEEVKYIITVYEPDPQKWEAGFTRRRRPQ